VCTSLRLCLECGVGSGPVYNIPTSPPLNAAFPTLPSDLFSQFDLNKINGKIDSSSFRHRRAVKEEEKEE
ncbi:hypothetical protein PFISCL1PPCAC_6788, partial [Pristionchus fissidentatus]